MHNFSSPAPRVTPMDIEAAIKSVYFYTARQGAERALDDDPHSPVHTADPEALSLLTHCVIVMKSGFTVTGESACVSPVIFDAEEGKRVALLNAKSKLWLLLGFALKEKLFNQPI